MEQIKKLELVFKLAVAGVVIAFIMCIISGVQDAHKEKQIAEQVGEIPRPAF